MSKSYFTVTVQIKEVVITPGAKAYNARDADKPETRSVEDVMSLVLRADTKNEALKKLIDLLYATEDVVADTVPSEPYVQLVRIVADDNQQHGYVSFSPKGSTA